MKERIEEQEKRIQALTRALKTAPPPAHNSTSDSHDIDSALKNETWETVCSVWLQCVGLCETIVRESHEASRMVVIVVR